MPDNTLELLNEAGVRAADARDNARSIADPTGVRKTLDFTTVKGLIVSKDPLAVLRQFALGTADLAVAGFTIHAAQDTDLSRRAMAHTIRMQREDMDTVIELLRTSLQLAEAARAYADANPVGPAEEDELAAKIMAKTGAVN